MYSQLFRNRWIALAFVVMIAFGAANLVGSEDDEGFLGEATNMIEGEREQFAEESAALSGGEVAPAPPVGSFASDEELVEGSEGFEPDPIIDDLNDPSPDVVMDDGPVTSSQPAAPREFVIVDGQVQIVE